MISQSRLRRRCCHFHRQHFWILPCLRRGLVAVDGFGFHIVVAEPAILVLTIRDVAIAFLSLPHDAVVVWERKPWIFVAVATVLPFELWTRMQCPLPFWL